MQRVIPSNNHKRSQSLSLYEELCHKNNVTENIPFRRKAAAEFASTAESDEKKQSLLLNEDQVENLEVISATECTQSNTTTTTTVCDLTLPISCCFISDPQQQQPSVSFVKGHRRSLSLRQRLEVGYDYLSSELEHAREFAGKTVTQVTETVWKVCNFSNLPNWMQDNEYLHTGHRPPLPSYKACAKSIFRLHTETGNIWTHGLGLLIFIGLFIYEFVTIGAHKTPVDRMMLAIYFCGICLCLFFSTIFHTFSCHASPKVSKLFSKLDYCGISIQIIGSMIPALYYGFYEYFEVFKVYITIGGILCVLSIIVSMWDKFGEPRYRSFRAMVFLCFGLSNIVPGIHWYIILDSRLFTAFGMFILQGILYVIGSLLYANRIPERFFPGKCDYWFQSHQIFHVLVVMAALVHLNGINWMAEFHLNNEHLATTTTTASTLAQNIT